MDLVWLCLCLGVSLLSSGIDAVKLIPIHTKTVETDGATHEISRYIVVPDDHSNERNDDVILKKIELRSKPISHSSNDGEPNISKLLGINTGKSDDEARDIVNSKVVQYSETVNSPSSIKYHLVLGGKSEADKVSEHNRNLDLFNINDGAKTKQYSMTATTQNEEAKFGKDRNNEKAQASGGSTNWSYNIRESSSVPNVGVEETQKVQKIIKAGNEVETQRSVEQSSSKETADDHKKIDHYQIKTVTKTIHKPITKIKLKDLPIKWDTTSDNQLGPHPLLSSIAINKTFTLPGKRGRFKLIYEDDDDIDTVIDNQVFKQNTEPMTEAQTHYYINNNYSIDSLNKNTTDGIHLNNDLSLGSPRMKSTEQTYHENNIIQLSVPKFSILSTSTPDSKAEISKTNSSNSLEFTKAHTISSTKNEGSGDHKLTIKTSKIIQRLGDNGSKQVHTSYGYLSGSSATNQSKDLARKAASNNYSDDENLHHTVVTKYITTNTNESPLKSNSSNISLQNIEEPTPIATKTKTTVVSKSSVRQKPKHKDDVVTSSDTETYVQANPDDDENTASESLNDHDILRTTSNIIKITNMSPINHSQLHVIPLNHKTDLNESSHIERIIIIPTVHKNSTTIEKTSKTNEGDRSSNGLLDNNNDRTESPVSHTNEFVPDTEKTADNNIVETTTESRKVLMHDIIHIPSSKTNTKETASELDLDIHTLKITTVDTNYTSDKSLSDQNKVVANIDSPINDIVPVMDKTTHELSVDSLLNTIDAPHGLRSSEPTSSERTNVHKNVDDDENKNKVSETEMSHVAVNVLNDKREDVIGEEGYTTINTMKDGYLKATTLPMFNKIPIEQNNDDDDNKNKHTILRTDDISHEAVKPTHNREYVVNYQSFNRDNEGNEVNNGDTINDQEKESHRIEASYSSVNQNKIPEGVSSNSISSKKVTTVPETDENESSISKTQNSHEPVKTQNRINVTTYLGTRHEHVKEEENEESINDLKKDSARMGAGSLLINQNITPTYATTASSTNENVLDDVDSHGNGELPVENHTNVTHYLGYSHRQSNKAVEHDDSINDSREDTARAEAGSLQINQNIVPKYATTAAPPNENMLDDVDSHDKREEKIGEEYNDTINALQGGYIKTKKNPTFDKITIEQNNDGDNKHTHTILKTDVSHEAVIPTHNYVPVNNHQSINRHNEGNGEDNEDTINDQEKESKRIEIGYSSVSQNEIPEGDTTTSLFSKEVTIVPETDENESSISKTRNSVEAVKTQNRTNVLDYLGTRHSEHVKEEEIEESINDLRIDSARMGAGSLLISQNITPTHATTASSTNENVLDNVDSHGNGDLPVENHTNVIHYLGYSHRQSNKAVEHDDSINDSREDTARVGAGSLRINQNIVPKHATTAAPPNENMLDDVDSHDKREEKNGEEDNDTIIALQGQYIKTKKNPTFDKITIEQNNDGDNKHTHTILKNDISHEVVKPTYNHVPVINYQNINRHNERDEVDKDDTINDLENGSHRIKTGYSSVSQNEIPEGVTRTSLSSKEVTIVPETDENESSISKTLNSEEAVKTQNRINVLDFLGTRHSDYVKEEENEESINDLKKDSARMGAGSSLISQNIIPTHATTASSTNENVLDDVDSHGNGDLTVENHTNVIHYLGYSHKQSNKAVEHNDSINDSREDTARVGAGSLRINKNIVPKHATTAAPPNENMLDDVDSHDKREEKNGEEDIDTINALQGGYIKTTKNPTFDKITIGQTNDRDNEHTYTILKTYISHEAVKPTHNHVPVINYQSINRHNEGDEVDNDDTINDQEKGSHRIKTGYSSVSQNEIPEGVTRTSLSSNEITIVPETDENEGFISKTQNSDVAVKTQKILNVLDYLETRHNKDIKENKNEDSINDSREDSAPMGAGSLLINENITPTLATIAAPINENVLDDVDSHENGDVPVENHIHGIHNVGYRYSKNNKAGENEYSIIDSVEDTTRMGADSLLINQNRVINDITTTMPTSNYSTILPGELNSDEIHNRQSHSNLLNSLRTYLTNLFNYNNNNEINENDNPAKANDHVKDQILLPKDENTTVDTLSNGIPETNTEYAKTTPQTNIRIDDSYSNIEINSPKSNDNENIKFRLGSQHHKRIQTNSEIIDDLATNLGKKYYNGNSNGKNKYTMHTEQSKNVSPSKAMIFDYYDEDANSSESDEYGIPEVSRAKDDYETHHKDYARPNRIIYQKKLTDSKVKTSDTNDRQYLGVASENNPYAPENSYAIYKMEYGPSHMYNSQKISKYNEYLSYVLKYLKSINIIPEINAYCASLEPGVVKNELIMQIILKHLYELGIHEQQSLEQFYMLAQHLVYLIEGHSSIHCKTNRKHKNDDKVLPIVISKRYYANPYAYVYAKSDALNQNKKLQDKAKLQQLLDSVNVNVGCSQASNIKSKILKVIKYLRNLKVPEAIIIEFVTEVKNYLSTELIESLKAECQSRFCSSLVKRIDMIGIKYLPDCHKKLLVNT